MAEREFRVSEESRSALEPYADLPRNDPRRVELFSFLAETVVDPNVASFEQDHGGLRWTWLEQVALVWRLDLVLTELDVVFVWDRRDDD